jgi:hypothetical protein
MSAIKQLYHGLNSENTAKGEKKNTYPYWPAPARKIRNI